MGELPLLQSLDAGDTLVTDAALPFLARQASLTDLCLNKTSVTDAGMKSLADLKRLRTLRLAFTGVGDASLKVVAALPELQRLDLAATHVTDDGLPSLTSLPSLVSLDLRRTNVSDRGLEQLAAIKSLRTIWLKGTQTSPEGRGKLKTALQDCDIDAETDVEIPRAGAATEPGAMPAEQTTNGNDDSARDVALKVLPPDVAEDPARLARFQREAETLASLNHPNIAQIYGVEDRALVMELVEGEDLSLFSTWTAGESHSASDAFITQVVSDSGVENFPTENTVGGDLVTVLYRNNATSITFKVACYQTKSMARWLIFEWV
jgi:serine/threonine protein kinase